MAAASRGHLWARSEQVARRHLAGQDLAVGHGKSSVGRVGLLDPVYSQNIGIHGALGDACMEAIGFAWQPDESPSFVCQECMKMELQLQYRKILVETTGLTMSPHLLDRGAEKKIRSMSELLSLAKSVQEVYASLCTNGSSENHAIHQSLCGVCDTLRAASTRKAKLGIDELKSAFVALKALLLSPEGVTDYEIEASGLPNACVNYLSCGVSDGSSSKNLTARLERLEMLRDVFGTDKRAGNKLAGLLQAQLSQIEQFNTISYDQASGSRGLQALRKPLHLEFVRVQGEESLNKCSQSTVLIEPMATGQDIQTWLSKKVEKRWYEAERSSLNFIKYACRSFEPDANTPTGVIHWIATNGGQENWTNPSKSGLVSVTGPTDLPKSGLFDSSGYVLGNPGCAWVSIDLGLQFEIRAYSLSCAEVSRKGLLLLGSSTGQDNDWYVLEPKSSQDPAAPWEVSVQRKYSTKKRPGSSSTKAKPVNPKRAKHSQRRARVTSSGQLCEAEKVEVVSSVVVSKKSARSTKRQKTVDAPEVTSRLTRSSQMDVSKRTRSQAKKATSVPRVLRSNQESNATCAGPSSQRVRKRALSKAEEPSCDLPAANATRAQDVDLPKSFRHFKLVAEKSQKLPPIRIAQLEMFGVVSNAVEELVSPTPTGAQASEPVTWEWNDETLWNPYDGRTSARLELAHQMGEARVNLTTGYFSTRGGYVVDLQRQVQINMRTGNQRRIRRQKTGADPDTTHRKKSLLRTQAAHDEMSLFPSSHHIHDLLGPSPVLRRDYSALAPVFDPVSDPRRAHSNPTQTLLVDLEEDADGEMAEDATKQQIYLYMTCDSKENGSSIIELADKKSILQAVQEKYLLAAKNRASAKLGRPDASWVQRLWRDSHKVFYSSRPPTPAKKGKPVEKAELYSSECEAACSSIPPKISASSDVKKIIFLLHILCGSGVTDQEQLTSVCLTNKLKTQMDDVLSLCCGTVPQWCSELIRYNPLLFGKAARFSLFQSRSLGFSRTVSRLDRQASNASSGSHSSFASWRQRIGHLVTDRIIVPRDNSLFFRAAEHAMKLHARRRTVLDFAFEGEEGTGSGPTAEFYTLVSMGFRDGCCACMWRDVNSPTGLFPALLPSDPAAAEEILRKWQFFGRFTARALLDNRLVDMHLSTSFFQLLCGRSLTMDDVKNADPGLERLLDLGAEEIEAVCQTMSWEGSDLVPGGCELDVTAQNLDRFKQLSAQFVLANGIEQQMAAFSVGFEEACPISSLHALTAHELQLQLTGDGALDWTLEVLQSTIEPKHGYTADSPAFSTFLSVLDQMDNEERKTFVWWATGSPRLPPGGLEKLSPQKLSVVLKTEGDRHCDDIMVSVNVCNKAIKLPAYSSMEILRERLRAAMNTKEAREFTLT